MLVIVEQAHLNYVLFYSIDLLFNSAFHVTVQMLSLQQHGIDKRLTFHCYESRVSTK